MAVSVSKVLSLVTSTREDYSCLSARHLHLLWTELTFVEHNILSEDGGLGQQSCHHTPLLVRDKIECSVAVDASNGRHSHKLSDTEWPFCYI
jgi:hypothetical protein